MGADRRALTPLRHEPGLVASPRGPVPLRRPVLTGDLAGAALGHLENLDEMLHGTAPAARAQKFPWARSFRIWRSSAGSATKRFRRVFSACSSFRSFLSPPFLPPYALRPRWKVCSETPTRFAASATVRSRDSSASAARSRAMIGSGVGRFRFLVRSLPAPSSRGAGHADSVPAGGGSSYVRGDLRLAWQATERCEVSLGAQGLLHHEETELESTFLVLGTEPQAAVYGQVAMRF